MRDSANGKQTWTIVFSADYYFSYPLCLAVYSLLLHHLERRFLIYVLDGGVDERAKRSIELLKDRYDFEIVYWDIRERLDAFPEVPPRFSKTSFARFFIPELLPEDSSETVLYIDADVIFCEDLEPLFSHKWESGNALACVQDTMTFTDKLAAFRSQLCVPENVDGKYFFSGQILMHIPVLKKNRFLQRILTCFETRGREGLDCYDQDWLNAAFWGEIDLLPCRYCSVPAQEQENLSGQNRALVEGFLAYSSDELKEAARRPAIIHFAKHKPNLLFGPRGEQEKRFFALWRQSLWKREIPYPHWRLRQFRERGHSTAANAIEAFFKALLYVPGGYSLLWRLIAVLRPLLGRLPGAQSLR